MQGGAALVIPVLPGSCCMQNDVIRVTDSSNVSVRLVQCFSSAISELQPCVAQSFKSVLPNQGVIWAIREQRAMLGDISDGHNVGGH